MLIRLTNVPCQANQYNVKNALFCKEISFVYRMEDKCAKYGKRQFNNRWCLGYFTQITLAMSTFI
ncbi:MAG: hypothetical protein BGO59_25000 [Spirosoma sp. 48-14]|nr:MAG: hypothetical protein BGO59_25000 [Spirosoma sp. 48-14]